MNIFDEFIQIIKHIELKKIKYALVGGVAMAFYTQPRFTQDIDILIDPNDLENICQILKKNKYFLSAEPWTFKNTPLTLHRFLKVTEDDQMIIDLLVAGEERHLNIIHNALKAHSEHGNARIAEKSDIIWLKKKRNSLQDQADIERLENEED
ncbi:MAG: nucleotidyltransferase family protein [Desulfobacula sp.]|nr:nucleotidyltransferase family protein [Desulfobacula sp.]